MKKRKGESLVGSFGEIRSQRKRSKKINSV